MKIQFSFKLFLLFEPTPLYFELASKSRSTISKGDY